MVADLKYEYAKVVLAITKDSTKILEVTEKWGTNKIKHLGSILTKVARIKRYNQEVTFDDWEWNSNQKYQIKKIHD